MAHDKVILAPRESSVLHETNSPHLLRHLQQHLALTTILEDLLPQFIKGAMAYQLIRHFEMQLDLVRSQQKRIKRIMLNMNYPLTELNRDIEIKKEGSLLSDSTKALDYPIGYIRDSGLLICATAATRKMLHYAHQLRPLISENDMECSAVLKTIYESEKKMLDSYSHISLSQIYFNK